MSKYLVEIVPSEVTKFLSRLNAISDEAWKMVEDADKDEDVKTKAQALSLAQKSALYIVNVLANNKHLVDEAFKFASAESSSSGDEESSGQDQEQEGGDEDDIEKDNYNNNNDFSGKDTSRKEPEPESTAGV